MYLAADKQLLGLLSVSDPIKASTPEAVASLHAAGMRVVMATGDGLTTARSVAARLEIDEVHGEVKPADKLVLVEKLQKQGRVVGMAGDGINDAPALAKADVGVAMGTGTDVAMSSAQVTLVKGDLRGIARARLISLATVKNMRQNLGVRVPVQRARGADRCRRAVSVHWLVVIADDCRARDESLFRVGHHERAAPAGERVGGGRYCGLRSEDGIALAAFAKKLFILPSERRS